jgi:hypothetical protein
MTIERRSIVAQIEIPCVGGVQVLIHLQMVEDGSVISHKNHRTFIPVDISPAEQMAHVNGHLSEMGEAQISSADIQRVGMFHKLAADLPSEFAPAPVLDEVVENIKRAKASRKVDPQ